MEDFYPDVLPDVQETAPDGNMAHRSGSNQHMPWEDLPGTQHQELFLPQPTLPGPGQATAINVCETGVLTHTFHYWGYLFQPLISLAS